MAAKISTLTPANCAIKRNNVQTDGLMPIVSGDRVLYIPLFGKGNERVLKAPGEETYPNGCSLTDTDGDSSETSKNIILQQNPPSSTIASKINIIQNSNLSISGKTLDIKLLSKYFNDEGGVSNYTWLLRVVQGGYVQYQNAVGQGSWVNLFSSKVSNNFLTKQGDYMSLFIYKEFSQDTYPGDYDTFMVAKIKDGNNIQNAVIDLNLDSTMQGYISQSIYAYKWEYNLSIFSSLKSVVWSKASTYKLPDGYAAARTENINLPSYF